MHVRNAKTYDNKRLFGREDWLTKLQVQGFFSHLACARRKQGWYGADMSEEVDEGDEVEDKMFLVLGNDSNTYNAVFLEGKRCHE